MNYKLLFTIILSFFSLSSMAATQVVPVNRLGMFYDGTFASSEWTRGTAAPIISNSIYILKSTGNVTYGLVGPTSPFSNILGIEGSGKYFLLDSKDFLGIQQARISDPLNKDSLGNPIKGQCVDFVKTMLGNVLGTSSWYPGTKLSSIPSNQLADTIPLGTVIAYFDGKSQYSLTNGKGHVAIVLNFTFDSAMNPTGMTVLDQNFLSLAVTVKDVGTAQSPDIFGNGMASGGAVVKITTFLISTEYTKMYTYSHLYFSTS